MIAKKGPENPVADFDDDSDDEDENDMSRYKRLRLLSKGDKGDKEIDKLTNIPPVKAFPGLKPGIEQTRAESHKTGDGFSISPTKDLDNSHAEPNTRNRGDSDALPNALEFDPNLLLPDLAPLDWYSVPEFSWLNSLQTENDLSQIQLNHHSSLGLDGPSSHFEWPLTNLAPSLLDNNLFTPQPYQLSSDSGWNMEPLSSFYTQTPHTNLNKSGIDLFNTTSPSDHAQSFYPLASPSSSLAMADGKGSGDSAINTMESTPLWRCTFNGCEKSFSKRYQLK
jgi:hypothetical protein